MRLFALVFADGGHNSTNGGNRAGSSRYVTLTLLPILMPRGPPGTSPCP